MRVILLFCISILVLSCARRGRPEGGPKDLDKPIMVKATPPFKTINFDEDEIKIYFDEFIKLKEVNTQLIVSPPLKYPPVITPLGSPSKFIKIKLKDTLQENTTYTFNFGQSVIDNTENNVLDNFKYILSTGSYIDSLHIQGYYKHAFDLELEERPTIMLYEVTQDFKDSIIYNKKPMYVGTVLDSVRWNVTNIKAGKYLVIAVNDLNKNYKYEPKSDEIGFCTEFIEVPGDTSKIHNLKIFKEILDFKIPSRAKEVSKGHLIFGYEGNPTGMEVSPLSKLPSDYKSVSVFDKEKDTLHYYFDNFDQDSILFSVAYQSKIIDTMTVKLREDEIDSLAISKRAVGSVLDLRDTLKLVTNTPIQAIDTSFIYFIDQDSVKVNYTTHVSPYQNELFFNFEKAYDSKYQLELYPGAVNDFYGVTNDSLKVQFSTKRPANYSSIFLSLKNIKSYPIIVEMIDNKGDVVADFYSEYEQEYRFENIPPSSYMIRIIYDSNKNKKWDTGHYLTKQQPEEVYYFSNVIDAKPNWEITETLIIKNQ